MLAAIASWLLALIQQLVPHGISAVINWWSNTRPLRQVWRFRDGETIYIIGPRMYDGEIPANGGTRRAKLLLRHEEQVRTKITVTLRTILPACNIISDTADRFTGPYDANLILVGGPIHNPITGSLLESRGSPLTFDGNDIVDADKRLRWEAESYRNGRLGSDMGVVVVRPISNRRFLLSMLDNLGITRSSDKKVYFVMGCHAPGALVAATMLTEPHWASQMAARLWKARQAIIVRASLNPDDSPGVLELIHPSD